MNLLKELEPFNEHLDLFKKGYGITDVVAINKLADIWDRFADTRKKAIYGSETAVIPKTKTSCASCVKDMMNMLYNWRDIVKREPVPDLVEFKAVKKANVTEVVISGRQFGKTAATIEWAQAELTAKGIKYHHKMKLPKLLELLNGH